MSRQLAGRRHLRRDKRVVHNGCQDAVERLSGDADVSGMLWIQSPLGPPLSLGHIDEQRQCKSGHAVAHKYLGAGCYHRAAREGNWYVSGWYVSGCVSGLFQDAR
jgi:hypothetical protein